MRLLADPAARTDDLISLFTETFAHSEGAEEGHLIGKLTADILSTTANRDLYIFVSEDGDTLTGCIAFTRLVYPDDPRTVFLLSPVAVRPDHQRQGIGQRLLSFGLDHLRDAGIDVVLTYGDPNYYSRVGFAQITPDIARPPHALSQPHGWLGQSLTSDSLAPLIGPCRCIEAFNDPAYW